MTDDPTADDAFERLLNWLLESEQTPDRSRPFEVRGRGSEASALIMRQPDFDYWLSAVQRGVLDIAHTQARLVGIGKLQSRVAALVAQMGVGQLILIDDEVRETAPTRPTLMTAQRILDILIILIAVLVLRVSTELSAHDASMLMNAIAIAGGAIAVRSTINIKPPDDND